MLAQTQEVKDKYPLFAAAADKWGFKWEPYTCVSEDGWVLSLFHILSDQKGNPTPFENMKTKPPVLFMHGIGNSATSMMRRGNPSPTIAGELANLGYDVFMGSFRGTIYSNTHVRDGDPDFSLKDRWDFTWAEQGYYDIPVFVDKIIEITGLPKVTLLGYSMGSAASFYALAKRQDFFAPRIHRYVSIATCVHADTFLYGYENAAAEALYYYNNGWYNYDGGDEAQIPSSGSRVDGGYARKCLDYF